ncbi:hypothetical protein [Marinobacterium mangrovicola]|uniref:Uncharacterized protein n=1 Tax=Marinobacterium mangrovicola TaxID=1476959 RepID=A0A4R1G7S7_9GAMM|nr:hypothetical protein [Marinobacterium mangrovicola]TCK03638.1 hypothetical protein CLV83_3912 [Marinobacterium mangrovicola]
MKQHHSRKRRLAPELTLLLLLAQLIFSTSLHADEDRAKRPFVVTDIPEADLQVYIPARPQWNWEVQPRRDTHAVMLSTPEQYYPPTSIDIVSVPDLYIKEGILPFAARKSLATVRESSSTMNPTIKRKMEKVTYGDIIGYEEILSLSAGGKDYDARSFSGRMPSGRSVGFFAVTAQGQSEHILPMLTKIISNLKPLSQ